MKKVICMLLCLCMSVGMVSMLSGCKNKQAADAFVIQTEQLDGLFNPFFSTSATDGTIVAMTQIGMLSSKYVDGKTEVAYGENEAVVTLDYEIVDNGDHWLLRCNLLNCRPKNWTEANMDSPPVCFIPPPQVPRQT